MRSRLLRAWASRAPCNHKYATRSNCKTPPQRINGSRQAPFRAAASSCKWLSSCNNRSTDNSSKEIYPMKRCFVPTCLLWLSLSVVAATAEPIRVSVGSDPAFTAFYYASQQKLFEKAGLDVRLSIVTQAGDAMDGLVA